MASDVKIGKILLIIIIGLLIGTALGELIGRLLSPGWLKTLFLTSFDIGEYLRPFLEKLLKVFIQFFLKFNIMSIVGILVAYWFNKK